MTPILLFITLLRLARTGTVRMALRLMFLQRRLYGLR